MPLWSSIKSKSRVPQSTAEIAQLENVIDFHCIVPKRSITKAIKSKLRDKIKHVNCVVLLFIRYQKQLCVCKLVHLSY